MNVRPFLFWLENGQWFAIHEQFESSKSVFLENFFGCQEKGSLAWICCRSFSALVSHLYLIIYLSFLPSSHSVPKALSALAASDTDEEDQESTPVITNGNGESAAVASAKPTAPLPSENDGKLYLLKSTKQRPPNKSLDPKVSSYCSWYSMNIPAGHGTLFLGQLSINHLKSRCLKNRQKSLFSQITFRAIFILKLWIWIFAPKS